MDDEEIIEKRSEISSDEADRIYKGLFSDDDDKKINTKRKGLTLDSDQEDEDVEQPKKK